MLRQIVEVAVRPTDGHTLCMETLDNGDLLFILYSMNLNTFKDGELLRIPININGEGTAKQGKRLRQG